MADTRPVADEKTGSPSPSSIHHEDNIGVVSKGKEEIEEEQIESNDLNHHFKPELAPQYTQAEENAVIRKLDLNLLPMVFVLYSLSVLDRSNLGNARIAGMQTDINLSGNRYDWLGTVFYIAYILSQWTMLGWKAFPPHVWTAWCVFWWGVISAAQAATTSWGGLMVCRTLLGVVEAGYGPGITLYLSYFYPREKLGFRTGVYLAGSAAANAYGGVLAYGISQAKGSISSWRILFLIEGLPTVVLAAVAFFFVPDSPQTARFLNERERQIAIDLSLRQPGDRTGHEGIQFKQALGALLDYRSYLPPIMYFGCNVCFASLPLFVPTIISEMGAFNTVQSNGLSAPPYVLCLIAIISCAKISDIVGWRGPFVTIPALLAAIGYIILATTDGVGPRYFGLFLATLIFVSVAMLLVWVGNTHETDSKRAAGLAILATGGQCGPVLGTNIFPTTDKPYYRKGMWISCGACLIVFFVSMIQMFLLHRENKKRDKEYGQNRETVHLEQPNELGRDKQFRYMV